MNNQIIEMLSKLNSNIEKRFSDVNNQINLLKSDIESMSKRLNSVESKLDLLDLQLNNGFNQTIERLNVIDDRLKLTRAKTERSLCIK